MVPAAALYAVLGSTFMMMLTAFIAMTKLIGDRIGDQGGRIDSLQSEMRAGFTRIDTELAAIRGAVVDLGQRVTRLERNNE